MNTNDFVPFCNENTGTNLPTQSAYLANPALPIGNQPGIASSTLNNKALRQATTMAAVFAQVVSDSLAVDMLDAQNSADHAIPVAVYKAAAAQLRMLPPIQTALTTGSGTFYPTYKMFIAAPVVAPTATATYSDGSHTFTVSENYNGVCLLLTGVAFTPAATSGTLTKITGTGDATLTYYAYRAPLLLRVRMVGGGGSGGGGGTVSATSGSSGNDTTFGTLTAKGGGGGNGSNAGGNGGSPGGNTFSGTGLSVAGCFGSPAGAALGGGINATEGGGSGGSSFFGGGGAGGSTSAVAGQAGQTNTGGGGGGGGSGSSGASAVGAGGGGASGGFIEAFITALATSYAYAVGAAQASVGAAGTAGAAGGPGGSGVIIAEQSYQ